MLGHQLKGFCSVKLNFELPILVRGRPKSSSSVADVYCTTAYSADVPEVSLREMPIVFEARNRAGNVPNDGSPEIVNRILAKTAELKTSYQMRAFAGRCYRKIAGSREEGERLDLFATPFDALLSGRLDDHRPGKGLIQGWLAEYGGDISPIQVVPGNGPLARPLIDEFDWLLDRRSTAALKSKTAWPKPGPRESLSAGWHRHRNAVRLGSVDAPVKDIDQSDLAAAMAMIQRQVDRLVVADGEIWMASRPPAYRVQFKPSVYKGPPSEIVVAMVTAPESFVGNLNTLHFSLGDEDEAIEVAKHLYGDESKWGEGFTRKLLDFRVPYECSDETLLDYEYQQEEINRVGYTAAFECHAFLGRKPNYESKLTQQEIDVIGEAFAATLESNYILGDHSDMSPFIPTLASAWMKLGYPQILTGGHSLSHYGRRAMDRAMDYVENAPISLKVQSSWSSIEP